MYNIKNIPVNSFEVNVKWKYEIMSHQTISECRLWLIFHIISSIYIGTALRDLCNKSQGNKVSLPSWSCCLVCTTADKDLFMYDEEKWIKINVLTTGLF